jgi:hypothetical protein
MAKKGVSIKDIGDGLKGINLETFGGIDGFLSLTSGNGSLTPAQNLRKAVPWMAKAVDMTANAISALPFDIVDDSGKVYDSSTDWKNKTGGIESPETLFYMLASSLCFGRAYLIPETMKTSIVNLQYCAPHTINEDINGDGLQSFKRTTDQGRVSKYYPVDKGEPVLMYFWLPDSDVEIGPALTYPAGTALMATNLLFSMDGTLQTYAERGFIPPTVLGAKGMPSNTEREKAESWWDRFLRGRTGQLAKIINTEALSVVKVGAGLEDIRGAYGELTKQAIESIATAFGIPSGVFMSDMAFATEIKHLTKIWYTTGTFVKIYKTIETGFNEQLFNQWGLHLKFKPDAIDAMQEEENERANAFSVYVHAGVRPSVAAQLLGIELPEGIDYAMLDADLDAKEAREQKLAEAQAARFQQKPEDKPDEKEPMEKDEEPEEPEEEEPEKKAADMLTLNSDQIKELNLWRQIAERNYRKGKGACVDFEVKALPDDMASDIRGRLKYADSKEDIWQAFDVTGQPMSIDNEAIKNLADAINRAVDAGVKSDVLDPA